MPRRLALGLLAAAAAALVCAGHARAGGPIAWCGSGEPAADQPDAVLAVSWHVLYVVPSNGVDRFASYAPHFAGDAAAMSNWWVGQDSTRRPRFDLLDAPGCASEYGRLDISFLRLATPIGALSFDEVTREVAAAGFDDPDKAYLVYVDDTPHAGDEYGICGEGGTDDTALAYAVVFLQACGQSYSDDRRQLVATHEIVHGLGAVLPDAPHSCDDGHVCDAANDLMQAAFDGSAWLGSVALDVGRDDYYGHRGAWWDTRNSVLLYREESPRPAQLAVDGLTATSVGDTAIVRWAGGAPPGSDYQVLAPDGSLGQTVSSGLSFTASAAIGQTLQWTLRALDPAGWLSAPATIRFKVGYGLVDANGSLLRDTVPPSAVRRLKATIARARVTLHWRPAVDTVGIAGYRVTVAGQRPRLVHGTRISLPLARVRGRRVSVVAVDVGGNRSASASVRVRR
ncbi:MAG TPA: hypothetical protein VFJ77_08720 [Gaiellaceae bacterium]|nr:hypothetical protein [Gaiellaceae bacterium]